MPVQPEISRDVPRETSDYVEGVGRRDESWCAGTMLCSGVVDNAAVCIVVARKRTVAHISLQPQADLICYFAMKKNSNKIRGDFVRIGTISSKVLT